jgi:deoxyuridine 5'-triphosphate nucleotidohydrolase
MTILVKIKLDPGAAMPTRAHDTDVGYDVKALRTKLVTIWGEEYPLKTNDDCFLLKRKHIDCAKIMIDTGVHVQPEEGYYVELVPNSRLAKSPFMYANSFGVIDPAYTGSIRVILNNVNRPTIDDLYNFLPGKVVGQLILRPLLSADFIPVDTLQETERGDGGFGSTANK